ncbi:hypothetical protein KOR34_26300 [Posidoniimonas corsicana]|uniref:Stigma-specific protein, Stig1 n=1 Tax=Posidoniimonas corsicana TaxID=1938618 RepID=A0A5C5VIE1_9BACT|nr:hypothetical protein [Posidoniimonas corsicana]TWT37670.1 hypothetical protein KOR34_26300 [Posidoniimonas corsicana]
MTAVQKSLSLGLVLLIAAANGCACCHLKGKGCGSEVGCCDTASGCDMAFQKFKGNCKKTFPICVCTGPCSCDVGCGCEPGCCAEPDCCADPACCAEPDCCADPDCCCDTGCDIGCGVEDCCDPCGCGDCCGKPCGCLVKIKRTLGRLLGGLCACDGCDGEVYWNEWHNDPPRCCDPCDKCGNWVGPSGGYRAPYDHPCNCN